jgi:hypothetical protein
VFRHRPPLRTASGPIGRMGGASPPIPCLARPMSAFRSMGARRRPEVGCHCEGTRVEADAYLSGQSPELNEAIESFTTPAQNLHQPLIADSCSTRQLPQDRIGALVGPVLIGRGEARSVSARWTPIAWGAVAMLKVELEADVREDSPIAIFAKRTIPHVEASRSARIVAGISGRCARVKACQHSVRCV